MSAAADNTWWTQRDAISVAELQLAVRNHGTPLEALAYDVTPLGLHYLLTHFDIPFVDEHEWRLRVAGHVRHPLTLNLHAIRSRPTVREVVTMECAGNGRAHISPRMKSQPWLHEAVGTALWTGIPLRNVLEEAGVKDGSVEVLFTGLDRGIQDGVEHSYERSLSLADAMRPEVILAYALNEQLLPPQHGFPLRLVVPGWYGMTNVKWLSHITVLTEAFTGFQQVTGYTIRAAPGDPGRAVTRMSPRSLMMPPGIPEFVSRTRLVAGGTYELHGRAWSGWGRITRVEVSVDGGTTWEDTKLGSPVSRHGWTPWSYSWEASERGEYELCSRAADEAGNIQPIEHEGSNPQGLANNEVQRVHVVVA